MEQFGRVVGLWQSYRVATTEDFAKYLAYLHARFEFIHPFADGNGRVGRTPMNYYLMTHNHPPLIVHDEDKRMYCECLQKCDEA